MCVVGVGVREGYSGSAGQQASTEGKDDCLDNASIIDSFVLFFFDGVS